MQVSIEGLRLGIGRLLAQPRDVKRWDGHLGDPGKARASAEHRALFDRYVAELRPVAKRAEDVWDREVEALTAQSGDKKLALREQALRMPSGPGGRPYLVEIIRRYWLACDELNRRVPAEQAVAPESLLLGWLANEMPHDPAVKVLACLPHWPMGLDPEGNWI